MDERCCGSVQLCFTVDGFPIEEYRSLGSSPLAAACIVIHVVLFFLQRRTLYLICRFHRPSVNGVASDVFRVPTSPHIYLQSTKYEEKHCCQLFQNNVSVLEHYKPQPPLQKYLHAAKFKQRYVEVSMMLENKYSLFIVS